MEVTTTLSNNEDVVNNIDENQNNEIEEQEEVEQQVDSQNEKTNTDDYEKAWESIDTSNPSEGLFGETTVYEAEEEVDETETETVDEQVDNNGLLIKNPILKYKGKEIPIDSEEELIALAQKGFKLENEMSKIKPYKQMINIIDGSNITIEDVKAYDDALKGNEQAKTYLAKKLGLESTSETETSFFDEVDDKPAKKDEYKPDVPQTDPVADYFASITEESPEVAGKISTVYGELDDSFKMEIYNKENFPMFAHSVATGEFEKVYPYAMKEKVKAPHLTWLDAYRKAGSIIGGKETKKATVPSKSTSIPKNGGSRRKSNTDSYDRAFEMDTKELEAQLFG